MRLGRMSLVLLVLSLSALACQKHLSSRNYSYLDNKADPISKALALGNWSKALDLTYGKRDPLLRLIRLRALYELKQYDEVLKSSPIEDPRFKSYDTFLRTLSAFEAEQYSQVVKWNIPTDLPKPLQERMLLLHGEALQELKEYEKAQEILQNFLSTYRRSSFRGDALIRLADIQLSLQETEEALKTYQELYRNYPSTDSEDIAKQKLQETGLFAKLDTDDHLSRIENLRRSALFSRASQEIEGLLKKTSDHLIRLQLEYAMAQVRFGERNYREARKWAERALLQQLPEELEIQWRQLLATSYIRLGDSDKGIREYETLLKRDIVNGLKENILYRLGMTALDKSDYEAAEKYFFRLRESFPRGTYAESAHWFGALAAHLRGKQEQNLTSLQEAKTLIEKIPDLPSGLPFTPLSLYWTYVNDSYLNDSQGAGRARETLAQDWPLSFHSRLLYKKPFQYVKATDLVLKPTSTETLPSTSLDRIDQDESWQRLELFRSVNLKTWASLELERFLESYRGSSKETLTAIALKLESVEDWGSLVRFAEKNFPRTVKQLDLQDPLIRFHYPRAYEQEVLKQAAQFNISPFLIWGLMREESRFRADVISSAGAVGVMQLMPSLGNRIGMKLRDPMNRRSQLTDPARNIRYGTYHLLELRNQIEGFPVPEDLKPILQVAAYNAGVEAVQRWLKQNDPSQIDLFVELIPFQETRGYVKRVLQSAYIYYRLYGQSIKADSEEPRAAQGLAFDEKREKL